MSKELIGATLEEVQDKPYSPGLRVGDFIYVAGQVPIDEQGQTVGDTIEAQTTRVLQKVQAVLEAGGATLDQVVKATVHMTDLSLFDRFNTVYKTFFAPPRPVRTTVGSILTNPAWLVEVDVVAYVGQ